MKAKETPIYATTYQLAEMLLRVTRNIPRDLNPARGQRIMDTSMNMILTIYRANAAREGRAELVEKVLEDLQVIEMAIRLASDQHLISRKQHGQLIELTDSIGRQGYRWKQDAQRRQAPRTNTSKRYGQNV